MNTSAKTSLALIALLTYHGTMVPMDNKPRLLNNPTNTRHLLLSDGSVQSTGKPYPKNKVLPVVMSVDNNTVMAQYPGNFSFEPANVLHKVEIEKKILNNREITTWSYTPYESANNPRS